MKKIIVLLILLACFSQLKAINQIRWGSTSDPLNGLTVTWSNSGQTDSIAWGYTISYEQGKFSGIKRAGYVNNFFKYTFPAVTPNAIIYYILYDSQTSTWTSQYTFKTSPPVNTTNYSFLALGDSRSQMSIWSQIANLANSKNTNFSVYTGDIVNSGASNSDWDNWFLNGAQYIQNNMIYHCVGNHDYSDTAKYQNIFELPQANGTKLNYSFTYGNAIFICLNSENVTPAQTTWLVSTLQANVSKTWKVLIFHRPFFTIGEHAGEMNPYLDTWWKAFDDYGVDIIFNGHDHMYERTKPINWGISHNSPVPNYGSGPGDGRCEIVCGGAGAPLYTGTPTWFIQTYQSIYNICKININGSILVDTTFDNNNAIIETFTIDKTNSGINNKNAVFNKISAFPNPSEGTFTVKYNSPKTGNAVITVYNLEGKKILEDKVTKTQSDLELKYNFSNNPKGVYTVEIKIEKQKDSVLLIYQ